MSDTHDFINRAYSIRMEGFKCVKVLARVTYVEFTCGVAAWLQVEHVHTLVQYCLSGRACIWYKWVKLVRGHHCSVGGVPLVCTLEVPVELCSL